MSHHEDMLSIANEIAQQFQQPGNIDQVVRHTDGPQVHISGKQGCRDSQEDQFRQYSGLDMGKKNTYPRWLASMFKTIGHDNREQQSGSTCTLAVIGRDRHITVAHIGDSAAVLFMRNRDTGEVTWKHLTTDHNLKNEAEVERITAAKGLVEKDEHGRKYLVGREGRWLAVSRAFGDRAYRPWISCKPDIEVCALDEQASAQHTDFYLMVCCDGVLERDGLNAEQRKRVKELNASSKNPGHIPSKAEEDEMNALETAMRQKPPVEEVLGQLATIISSHGEDSSQNIAQLLTAKALHDGSRDNVTALLTKIQPEMAHDTILMVADGHGGPACAKAVAEGVDRHVNVLKMTAALRKDPAAFLRDRFAFDSKPRQR